MPTTTTPERFRRFARGGPEIEVPVDALGRMRFRAELDDRAISRAEGDDEDDTIRQFRGHALVFNKRTWIGGRSWGFWEEIAPGATKKSLGKADIRFLINHDPSLLLARNREAKTLTLAEDKAGLRTDAELDTRQTYTSDVVISLERGDISQMSFAFEPIAWERSEVEDGNMLIRFTELRLFDVSVVTFPAYEQTDAGLRGLGFDALTRSLGLDAEEVLSRVGSDDLGAHVMQQISSRHGGTPGPAETTQDQPSGPPESTRDNQHRPPAETTGDTTRTDLRRRTLAARTASAKGKL